MALNFSNFSLECLVPCPLIFNSDIFKLQYTQCHKWKRHISHSHLNRQIPPDSLVLSGICPTTQSFLHCELSRFCCHNYSLLLLSYLRMISHKNCSCSACRQHQQDFRHLLFDCLASQPLRKSIFGPSQHFLLSTFGPDLEVWLD